MRGRAASALCLTAILFLGEACGVADPYSHPHPHRDRPVRRPEETRPARPPARVAHGRPQRAERAALRAFALASTNWSWRTITRSERQRARLATGALRRQLAADAAASADATLARDHAQSRGELLAIAPADGGRAYVVVRETRTSAGLEAIGDTATRVYRATLVRVRGGWLVSAWNPVE